jgi:hypothetical protein
MGRYNSNNPSAQNTPAAQDNSAIAVNKRPTSGLVPTDVMAAIHSACEKHGAMLGEADLQECANRMQAGYDKAMQQGFQNADQSIDRFSNVDLTSFFGYDPLANLRADQATAVTAEVI